MRLRSGSLCTGYGGLMLAVGDALATEPLWCSEYEPPSAKVRQPTQAAARILAHRFPDLPNLGDMQTIDWSAVPEVDVTEVGYPCPGESAAGKRLGMDDPRWMWPAYYRLILEMRPRLAVGENVYGHLSKSFRYVVADLQQLGYAVVWAVVSAADVGACHERRRLFWLAYDEAAGPPAGLPGFPLAHLQDGDWVQDGLFGGVRVEGFPPAGTAYAGGVYPALPYARVRDGAPLLPTPRTSDTNGAGSHGTGGLDLRTAVSLLPTPRATDGTKCGPNQRGSSGDLMLPAAVQPQKWGEYAAAVARWESLTRPAPAPTVPGRNGGQRLNPALVEWMMDTPEGHICDVPGLTRNEMLRAGGNGVVRRQGAAAVRHLAARLPAGVLTPAASLSA